MCTIDLVQSLSSGKTNASVARYGEICPGVNMVRTLVLSPQTGNIYFPTNSPISHIACRNMMVRFCGFQGLIICQISLHVYVRVFQDDSGCTVASVPMG